MSYCPDCGKFNAHVHLGWLIKKTRHAQIHCSCGKSSIIIVAEMKTKGTKMHKQIVDAIRKVFGWKEK